jgi:hypothetical protein
MHLFTHSALVSIVMLCTHVHAQANRRCRHVRCRGGRHSRCWWAAAAGQETKAEGGMAECRVNWFYGVPDKLFARALTA